MIMKGGKQMPKLRCSAEKCLYNQEKFCARNRIHVQGSEALIEDETQCGTFKVNNGEKVHLYKTEFARLDGANEHLSINCDCYKCLYNSNDLCTKDFVKISGGSAITRQQTVCESFAKRVE